ncbi:hypothetical protein L7F22_023418 [Adiantum nelumboides]|nr:hypothetical protein [Adiantum nelumboides]
MAVRDHGWVKLMYSVMAGSKWKRKPRESKSTETGEKAEQRQQGSKCWRVGEMKVQVYAAPEIGVQEPTLEDACHHHPHQADMVHLHCGVEFDPEKDYAQVLAEARSHMKASSTFDSNMASSTCTRPLQHHLDAYKELHSKLRKPNKPSKLLRHFFFWHKTPSLSEKQVEAEFESIFSSPRHPSSQILQKGTCNHRGDAKSNSSTARHTAKGVVGHANYNPRRTRKNNSGPLYTDGLPAGPFNVKHTKKSYSGPLGPTSCGLNPHLSPYQLLHRPQLSSPLYSC